jgi:hypothetical protein
VAKYAAYNPDTHHVLCEPDEMLDEDEALDARYVLLQAVHWNQSLEDQPYRASYGAHSLSYLLTGNRHMLSKRTNKTQLSAPGG